MQQLPIFVYGTLKRGEVRAKCWPHAPVKIEEATIQAALFDLGPYPALTDGDDLVLGELWLIAAENLEETLTVLDQIECFGVDDVDLYVRRITTATLADGTEVDAYAYFIADPSTLEIHRRVMPDRNGICTWSAKYRKSGDDR